MSRVFVICCVGLTPALIGEHTPHLRALAQRGFMAPLNPVLPAVTCSAQTSMLTGVLPQEHGIVGNGWYFRDQGEVWLWRQSQQLIQAPSVWKQLRDEALDISVHKHFWWYAMNTDVNLSVTPRPAYHADGKKSPDIYTWPPALKDSLIQKHGEFPLFKFWGPLSNIVSTAWIADSFCSSSKAQPSDLSLCYLPHLDYDLQRFGPNGEHLPQNLKDIDDCIGKIIAHADQQHAEIVVVSEYGIEDCDHGVPINRVLRQQGLLAVTTNATGELLDPGMSGAFAVCDHQIAHIYCKTEQDLKRCREALKSVPGIDRLYVGSERREIGLDHERSGEIVAIAAAGAWFLYDYWLEDHLKPDFAHSIEIHKKPGYDPRELFFDPKGGKLRAAKAILRKKLGLRYTMNPVPLDDRLVKGSHGRAPSKAELGPILITSNPKHARDNWHQCDIAALLKSILRV